MLKRICAFLICVFCAFTFSGFCEPDCDHLMRDIEGYLEFTRGIRDREMYAFEYVDAFLSDRTQENLLKARAAVQAAIYETQNAEIPQSTVTDDEIGFYLDADIKIEVIFRYYEVFEELLDQSERTLKNVLDFLLYNVYYAPAADNYAERLAMQAEYSEGIMLNAQYTARHFLLQFEKAGIVAACPDELKE